MVNSRELGGTTTIDRVVLDTLFAHLLRRRDVFDAAREQLTPEDLCEPNEDGYRLIWRMLLDYVGEYDTLPGQEVAAALAVRQATSRPSGNDTVCTEIEQIINWAWSETWADEDMFNDDAALIILEDVLRDRHLRRPVSVMLAHSPQGVVRGLDDLLPELWARRERISTIRQPLSGRGYVDYDESEYAIDGVPLATGVTYIDEIMLGGSRPGEVNVLLGPTGVGKTLLSLQMFTGAAAHTDAAVNAGDSESLLHVYVHYECPLAEIRMRALVCGAQIHCEHADAKAQGTYEYTSGGHVHEYEQRLEGVSGLGEAERRSAFVQVMNEHAWFMDFSGNSTSGKSRGMGGVPEIAAALQAVQRQTGKKIGIVFVDWAGMAVRRYLDSKNKDESHQTAMLIKYVDTLKREVADRFGAAVWVAHQIRGECNRWAPTKMPTKADAEYCRSFAVNAAYCFCMSTKDIATSACRIVADKTRRSAPRVPAIMFIDGELGRMRFADGEFVCDPRSHRIVPSAEAARINTSGAAQVAAQPARQRARSNHILTPSALGSEE